MNFYKNCKCQKPTRVLMMISFIALILTVLVSVFQWDLWLAGTQWILVSVLFAVYALHSEACHKGGDTNSNE